MKRSPQSYIAALLFLFFSVFGSITLRAQRVLEQVDSTYRFCVAHPDDSLALDRLNSILNTIYSDYSDTALYYSNRQIKMARQKNWKNFEARGYNMVGITLEFAGMLDSAIHYYYKAEAIGKEIRDSSLLLDVYNNLGIAYSYQGMYERSVDITMRAIDIATAKRDERRLAMINNNIGLRYSELGQHNLGIDFYRIAIRLNKKLENDKFLASNYLNMGMAYHALKEVDTALHYVKLGLIHAKRAGNQFRILLAQSSLATIYYDLDLLDSAQTYLDSARNRAVEINDIYGIHAADYTQGQIYLKQARLSEAIGKLEGALSWFEAGNYKKMSIRIYEHLAEAYKEAGMLQKAYEYMRRYGYSRDSVYTHQKDRAMQQVSLYRSEREERDKELLNKQIEINERDLEYQRNLRNFFFLLGIVLFLLLAVLVNRYMFERKTKRLLKEKNGAIEKEKDRSEKLLLNILPADVAEELKEKGASEARDFDEVTVLFSDFESFTNISENLSAGELVAEIDQCFKAFDEIMTKYKIEKIKTIGDAYMAAGGLQVPAQCGAEDVVMATLEMQEFIEARHKMKEERQEPAFRMRVGIHTGPVVAGIVGVKKFQYDIWGDTVNTASRMESNGEVGKVNITDDTYQLIKTDATFKFESRGKVEVKGKGEMEMWFVSKR